MIHLIPAVKSLDVYSNFLTKQAVFYDSTDLDGRLAAALRKLPFDPQGARLDIQIDGDGSESYTLTVEEAAISIRAASPAGAFYAIQTLRQLFKHGRIPCLHIQDAPDFAHRGFYHDMTRGKISSVATVKELIDRMAYFKLNSLQLYVEHVFPFEETKDLIPHTGCVTKEDLLEIQQYCDENFIEFIPSLSTFGHMYEILNQPQYRHLRVLSDHVPTPNVWEDRMHHHTVDPSQEESLTLVKSLIDQYLPLFDSAYFNICCDETFDLETAWHLGDPGTLYGEFVQKLISHVNSRGKKAMMWADILVKHPELIENLPEDTVFLSWWYDAELDLQRLDPVSASKRKMIVCPGCATWNRLCEDLPKAEQNICRMAEYGYRHGALGVLNTSWGDWGNPCSLELSMYGLVLGAEKSWSVHTAADDAFYSRVNFLLYEQENGVQYLKELCRLHDRISWIVFCRSYFDLLSQGRTDQPMITQEDLAAVQGGFLALKQQLSGKAWKQDAYRQEMLSCAEGLCVIAELSAKMTGLQVSRVTDTNAWLQTFSQNWLAKNKPSELFRLQELFTRCEAM